MPHLSLYSRNYFVKGEGGGGGGKDERLMLWAWLTNETRNKVEDEAPCSRYLVLLLRHIFVAFAHFSYRSSSCYVTAPLAMYIKSEAVGGGGGGWRAIKNR